ARRVQTIALFALAALAALGASAAVWFTALAYDTVARSVTTSAPVADRTVQGTGSARYTSGAGDPLDAMRAAVEQSIPVPGTEITIAGRIYSSVRPVDDEGRPTGNDVDLYVLARTDLCAHLTFVEGACPQR